MCSWTLDCIAGVRPGQVWRLLPAEDDLGRLMQQATGWLDNTLSQNVSRRTQRLKKDSKIHALPTLPIFKGDFAASCWCFVDQSQNLIQWLGSWVTPPNQSQLKVYNVATQRPTEKEKALTSTNLLCRSDVLSASAGPYWWMMDDGFE